MRGPVPASGISTKCRREAISRLIASRRHFVLKPDAGTQPRIFYLE